MRIDDNNLINWLNIMLFSFSFELSDAKEQTNLKKKTTIFVTYGLQV